MKQRYKAFGNYKPTENNPPEEIEVSFQEEDAAAQNVSLGITPLGRIDVSDSIYISTVNITGGNPPTLTLTWRVLGDDGKIIYGTETHLCNIFSAYAEKVTAFQPNISGSIISLSLQVTGEIVYQGEMFAQVGLFQGVTVAQNNRKNVLMSGYVATKLPITYPGNNYMPGSDSRFFYIGAFSGALPYYMTPYSTAEVEPYMIYLSYTTANDAAGDRRVFLELQDAAANTLGLIISDVAQPANTVYYYIFSRRVGNAAVLTAGSQNLYCEIELPEIIIPKGGRLKVDCLNRQGTDSSGFARLTGKQRVSF